MDAKSFIGDTLKYAFPSVISALVTIVAIPLITRLYPASDYGIISLYYSMGTLLASLFTLGLTNACVRFFYEPPHDATSKQLFNFTFFVGILVTSVVFVFTYIFAGQTVSIYLFGSYDPIALVLFFIYIISTICYRLQMQFARLSGSVISFNAQQIAYIVSNKLLFVVAVGYSTDYIYAILLITVATAAEVLFVGSRSLKFEKALPGSKAKKDMLTFSLPLLPKDAAVMIDSSVGKLIPSFFQDFYSLGVLAMATTIANAFALIGSAFSVYWGPFVYKNYKTDQQFIKQIHNYVVLASIAMTLAVFLFQDALFLMLDDSYRVSQSYFMLLMLMPAQILISETTTYGITLANKTNIAMVISLVSCSANLLISFFLYPFLGPLSCAIGIGVSSVLRLTIGTIEGQKFYSSISSARQTTYGVVVIAIVCVINLLVFNSFRFRFAIFSVAFIVTCIVYRDEVKRVLRLLKAATAKLHA